MIPSYDVDTRIYILDLDGWNRVNRQPMVHACKPPAMRSRESQQIGVGDS
jgi:hypothetical protein